MRGHSQIVCIELLAGSGGREGEGEERGEVGGREKGGREGGRGREGVRHKARRKKAGGSDGQMERGTKVGMKGVVHTKTRC